MGLEAPIRAGMPALVGGAGVGGAAVVASKGEELGEGKVGGRASTGRVSAPQPAPKQTKP
jgi:hypothetical protein